LHTIDYTALIGICFIFVVAILAVLILCWTGSSEIESHDPTIYKDKDNSYFRHVLSKRINVDENDMLYIKLYGQYYSPARHSIFSYFWGPYTLNSNERFRVNRAAMSADAVRDLDVVDCRFENGALRTLWTATCPSAYPRLIEIIRRHDIVYLNR